MTMKLIARGLAVACLPLAATSGHAETYTATSANFKSIYQTAVGGDTIVLSGSFGFTELNAHAGSGTVYIDARRAVFNDTLKLKGAYGIDITGGTYGSATARTSTGRAIVTNGGSDILVRNAAFIGNLDNKGIEFNDTNNAQVWSSTFTNLWAGAVFNRVTNGKAGKNASVGSVSDGFIVLDSHNVQINRNSCTGGQPYAGAHPDCVQMWSVLGRPVQSDIEISGNYAYGPTQGFTSFDPEKGGLLRGRLINNRVDVSYPQGIACYNCQFSEISGNVVTTLAGAQYLTRIVIIGGNDNKVYNNSVGPKSPLPSVSDGDDFTFNPDTASDDYYNELVASAPTDIAPSAFAAAEAFDFAGSAAAVPEPAVWAMLVAGFGAVGAGLRRRREGVVAA